jgi:hypothetical protein
MISVGAQTMHCRLQILRSLAITVILATLSAAFHLTETPAWAQDNKITLDQIEQAWHRRAERFESGQISWTVKKFIARGAISAAGAASPFGASTKDSSAAPPEDTRYDFSCELTFQGEKIRFEHDEPHWSLSINGFRQVKHVMAYDGKVGTRLEDGPNPSGVSLVGRVRPDESALLGISVAVPLLEFYCPELRAIDYLKRYEAVSRKEPLAGTTCAVLTRRTRTGVIHSLWLDPDAGFAVRKCVERYGNTIRSRREISYSTDAQLGLVPSGWKSAEYGPDGDLRTSEVVELTGVELNVPLDDTIFHVDFPTDTLVYDAVDTAETSEPERSYLVLEGDRKRPVTKEELSRKHVTLDELVSTQPGEAGLPHRRSGTYRVWLLGGLIVLLLCCVVAARKWRTR